MSISHPLIAGCLALGLLLVPRGASAFCRTTTNMDFVPTTASPCDTTGIPIAWSGKCVGYSLQKNASVQVDLTKASAIAAGAFAEWAAHDCTVCGTAGKPSIVGQDVGPVQCDSVEINQNGTNANLIVFRDGDWPHDSSALALTTVWFAISSGEIYDADMEIQSNPKDITLTADDPVPAGGYDLRSIITHEAGHFLGLAHTQPEHRDATMFASYFPGETIKRSLADDDVCGLCAAYPPTRPATCNATPRGGLGDECGGGSAKSGCGCSTPGGQASAAGLLVALMLGAMAFVRRRP